MSIAHLLEEFGQGMDVSLPGISASLVAPDVVEIARLEAYEEGYKAGWDDAIGANTSEQLQLSADVSQNLRDMAFTYQEAVTHVTQTLSSVFEELFAHFLPETAQMALAPKIREMIGNLNFDADNVPLTIAVAADNLRIMEKVAVEIDHKPVDIVEDVDLTAGQVSLRFGTQEVSLDFDALLAELRIALETAFPDRSQEVAHG